MSISTPASPKPTCQPYFCASSPHTSGPTTAPTLMPMEKIEKPRVRPLRIILGVQRAHLRRDVPLEQPASRDQQQEREQERRIERHRDVTAAHQHRADGHGHLAADQAVRDQPTEHRREIHEAGIEPVHLRRERQCGHRPEHRLERVTQRCEARDVLDVTGHEQRLAHVEHEQRGHAIVREPLPRFGERQIREPDRFAEERASGGASAFGR